MDCSGGREGGTDAHILPFASAATAKPRYPDRPFGLPGTRALLSSAAAIAAPACRAPAGCWLLAALLWLAALPTAAMDPAKAFHHYVHDAWSIEQGLPQITVLALAQDADGYLWVGTQAGLARFDGVQFTGYQPQNRPEIPGMLVQALLLDRRGRLWIGTYKGMTVYNDGVFAPVPAADPERFPSLDVQALAETADGRVLAATQHGVFEQRGGALVPLAGLEAPAVSLLVHGSTLLVGGRGRLTRRDAEGRVTPLPLPGALDGAVVTELLHAQGRLWAGTSLGLWWQDEAGWRPATGHPALAHSPVEMLLQDRDRNLWVGLADGLARFRDGALAEFVAAGEPGAVRSVLAGYEDHEGNLWLGTRWDGLARLWNGWTRRYSTAEGLHEPTVWSLARDPDGRRLWVGTNDGLALFEDGRFRQVVPGDRLPHPHAYTLLPEADGVWIGTRRGLAWLDHERGLVRPSAFRALDGTQVNGLLRDADGTLWLATFQGLYRWRDGVLRHYGEADGLTDRRARLLRRTREGSLLLGTQGGLFRLDGERLVPVGLHTGLPADADITAIHQLADGRLVVGTLAEQVFLEHEGRWHTFAQDQGMPVNSPFVFAEDHAGFLWIGGIRGVQRVPLDDFAALIEGRLPALRGEMLMNERGDRHAGQKGYCCNGAGNAKGFIEQGVLWLPSRGGVVAMDTAGIRKNPVVPPVHVERVHHSGSWHDAAAIAGQRLPADARDLAFGFTVLSFQDPLSTRLRYRLHGYDQEWKELEDPARRSANYTNLPPGSYRFEVQGANNAGIWNPAGATLAFGLQRQVWETRWFFFLMVGLALLLVYAAFRWQLRALHRQRAELAHQVRERTAELQQVNRQLREASHTDPLTRLRNRRYLADQLPADLAFYDREARGAGSVADGMVIVFALVDIDHFKQVNDIHGHASGDALLAGFAGLLQTLVRTGDYLVRWGGEEFLLVFRPMASDQLATIGERICGAVRSHGFDIGSGTPLHLTASVGFAEYPLFRDPSGGLDWQQMVELADQALYWVKRHGRDGWAAFRPTGRTDAGSVVGDLQKSGAEVLLRGGHLQLVSSRAG